MEGVSPEAKVPLSALEPCFVRSKRGNAFERVSIPDAPEPGNGGPFDGVHTRAGIILQAASQKPGGRFGSLWDVPSECRSRRKEPLSQVVP